MLEGARSECVQHGGGRHQHVQLLKRKEGLDYGHLSILVGDRTLAQANQNRCASEIGACQRVVVENKTGQAASFLP